MRRKHVTATITTTITSTDSNVRTLPGGAASSAALVGLVVSVDPLPSAAAPPSVPGALRISLDVREDMPVTAHPAQLEEAPAG